MIRSTFYLLLFVLSFNTFAQEKNIDGEHATAADIISSLETPQSPKKKNTPPMMSSSAELGFLYKTGNTNSGDIKAGLDFRFEKDSWLSLLNVDLLMKKADITDENGNSHFKKTDQKWTLTSQTNYNLDNKEKNYIYGNAWFEENEFSGFKNQASLSSGWGRHWYKSEMASLWGDIGPGYKRDLIKESETVSKRTADTWMIQLQALYIRKLGEHIELKQYLSAKQALDTDENSIYKAVSTITTKLISTLQLKFNFTLGYNSKVDIDKEKLDTQTAVTIVYSF
jgi:putative salt-induced outer membrane protein YdiY